MILSNVEIHRALDDGRLVILPEPSPRFPGLGGSHCPFDTHSVDLTLGSEIVVPNEDSQFSINLMLPGNVAATINRNSRTRRITHEQPSHLHNGQFVLGRTNEVVRLPLQAECDRSLAARIEGKSSRARFGLLVHFTAPTVHPGFDGTLTLEMINLGRWPLVLEPGMPIAQLIVEEVRGVPVENPSQFQGQRAPAGTSPPGEAGTELC